MRILVQHSSHYHYPAPAALGPHTIRLRPADHTRTRVESYRLAIEQEHRLHWQRDPHGNHVARVSFRAGQKATSLDLMVELALDVQPINPFDFFVDDRAKVMPFAYPDRQSDELAPFLDRADPAYHVGAAATAFLADLPRAGNTIDTVVAINAAIAKHVRYVIRDEAGVWTPEETLGHGRGSCRDSAVLLVAAARSRGIAARFVSGYLLQLTDEGMLPDEPRGVDRDVVDLHAWAEVYVPGAGWIGLDATSGLMCGEGHIPLACTASPSSAAPLDGTSDMAAEQRQLLDPGRAPRPRAAADRAVHRRRCGRSCSPRPSAPTPRSTAARHRAHAGRRADLQRRARAGAARVERRGARARQVDPRPGARRRAARASRAGRRAHAPHGQALPGREPAALGDRSGVAARRRAAVGRGSRRRRRPRRGDHARARGVADRERDRQGAAGRSPATAQAAFEDPWRLMQDEAQLPLGVDPRIAATG